MMNKVTEERREERMDEAANKAADEAAVERTVETGDRNGGFYHTAKMKIGYTLGQSGNAHYTEMEDAGRTE